MIWRWEAPLACGHTAYGNGRKDYPNAGDKAWCQECGKWQDITGRIYGQNW